MLQDVGAIGSRFAGERQPMRHYVVSTYGVFVGDFEMPYSQLALELNRVVGYGQGHRPRCSATNRKLGRRLVTTWSSRIEDTTAGVDRGRLFSY